MKNKLAFLSILLVSFTTLTALANPHSPPTEGMAPEKAYSEIRAGNKRFVSGESKHAGTDAAARSALVAGQKPHTIVLSCSDSRVPPELLFDQGLGRLFTVRVAGNFLDPATVASIEYAVEHLGARLLLVLGHESCGAVKAAMSTPPTQSAGSKDLDQLVSAIRPNLGKYRTIASEDPTLREPVKSNVNAVAEDLVVRSKIIRSHVDSGGLKIIRGIYGLKTGSVDFWSTHGLD